jgi:peptidoglycan/xylan/chitin deacetylase (PgdA/CDA1 family)
LKLLDAEGIREVSKQGMEVGSHAMSHPRLSELDAQSLNFELNESRRVLSEVLGVAVEGFCYPYGDVDGAVVQATRQAGYIYACATKKQVEHDVYDWPRIFVGQRDSSPRLWIKLKTPK